MTGVVKSSLKSNLKYLWLRVKPDWIEEAVPQGRQEGPKQLRRLLSRSTTPSPCYLVTYIFPTLSGALS